MRSFSESVLHVWKEKKLQVVKFGKQNGSGNSS